MKTINQVVNLTQEEVRTLAGGHQTVALSRGAYPILVVDEEDDGCPSAINPDGTFNKDSGWCGSGPGGGGINPSM